MNNKILKFLSIILLLFVGFFIKMNVVKAYDTWVYPMPIVMYGYKAGAQLNPSNSKFVNVNVEHRENGNEITKSYNVFQLSVQTLKKTFPQLIDEYIKENYEGESEEAEVREALETKLIIGVTGKDTSSDLEYMLINELTNFKDINGAKYIELSYDESSQIYSIATSSKEKYEEQYKRAINIDTANATYWEYYKKWNFNFKCSSGDLQDFFKKYDSIFEYRIAKDATGCFDIKDYLKVFGNIVFRAATDDVYYDKNQKGVLAEYHKSLLDYKKEKIQKNNGEDASYSIKELYQSWKILQQIIDAPDIDKNTLEYTSEDVDKRGYGKEYYSSTIDLVSGYIGNDFEIVLGNLEKNMDDNKNNDVENPFDGTNRGTKLLTADSLDRWFYYAGRYFLENGSIDEFIRYYKYRYAIDLSNGSKSHKTLLSLLEKSGDFTRIVETEKVMKEDSCIHYCPNCISTKLEANTDVTASNSKKVEGIDVTSCNLCKNNNSKYKSCVNYRITCQKKCSPVAASAYTACFNGCMDGKLKDYTKTLNETEEKIKELKKNTVKEMVDASISLIDAPGLDITFGDSHEINCDDVSFLHTIYMIIIILAPILTIIMGSIDYVKVMLNNDQEKMSKFKKQFPKRLIMLVLLIVIPIVISFITKSIAGLNDSLMYCVINGKS